MLGTVNLGSFGLWMYWAASLALSERRATDDGTVGNEDGIVKSIVDKAKNRTMPRTMLILRGGIRLVLGKVTPNRVCCTGIPTAVVKPRSGLLSVL